MKLPDTIQPYEETVFTTWEASYRAVEHHSSYAAHLLTLCGFFGPNNIPVDLFRRGSANDGMIFLTLVNSTDNRKWIDAQLDDALQEFFSFSCKMWD